MPYKKLIRRFTLIFAMVSLAGCTNSYNSKWNHVYSGMSNNGHFVLDE